MNEQDKEYIEFLRNLKSQHIEWTKSEDADEGEVLMILMVALMLDVVADRFEELAKQGGADDEH